MRAELCDMALTELDAAELIKIAQRAIERESGDRGIAIDFYQAGDRVGNLDNARYCVASFTWADKRWHRMRKLSGPHTYERAREMATFHSHRLKIPKIRHA